MLIFSYSITIYQHLTNHHLNFPLTFYQPRHIIINTGKRTIMQHLTGKQLHIYFLPASQALVLRP